MFLFFQEHFNVAEIEMAGYNILSRQSMILRLATNKVIKSMLTNNRLLFSWLINFLLYGNRGSSTMF
jgi:hypothetical protein